MVYLCSIGCNGWGDRLRDIMSVHILALVTRRRFIIDINRPCPISHVLQPNLVNWTFIPPSQNRNKRRTRLPFVPDVVGWKRWCYRIFRTMILSHCGSFTMTYGSQRINITLQLNFRILGSTNPGYLDAYQWTMLLNIIFSRWWRRPYQQLFCFHVRMGKNPSLPKDATFRRRKDLRSRMVQFLHQNQDTFALRVSVILVTSDGDQATNQILKHFLNKSITIPASIIHVNFIMMGKQKRDVLVWSKRCKISSCEGNVMFLSWRTVVFLNGEHGED